MARATRIEIRDVMRKLFPAALIARLARESGAVVRQRKVRIDALFWTAVFGFSVGRQRSLASLRRSYEKRTGQTLQESSFYNRWTTGFAKLMKRAVVHALDKARPVRGRLAGALAPFRDLILTDATVVRLHDLLARHFPGTRTNQSRAALKLHVVMSVTGAGPQSVKLTGERVADHRALRVGPWVAQRLLLFDLGYFKYQLLSRIDRNGGYFVTRLRARANPTIIGVNRRHRGASRQLIGRRLSDVLPGLKRQVLDVTVAVRFRRQRYAGRHSWGTMDVRLVGITDDKTGHRHLYLTNAPPDKLAAEDIGAVYAARWQVELLFAQLKRTYLLDELPSRKRPIVEALVFAAVLGLIVGQQLLAAFSRHLALEPSAIRDRRWAGILAVVADDLLTLMTLPPRQTRFLETRVARMLAAELPDPNVNRLGLVPSVEARRHRLQLRTP